MITQYTSSLCKELYFKLNLLQGLPSIKNISATTEKQTAYFQIDGKPRPIDKTTKELNREIPNRMLPIEIQEDKQNYHRACLFRSKAYYKKTKRRVKQIRNETNPSAPLILAFPIQIGQTRLPRALHFSCNYTNFRKGVH